MAFTPFTMNVGDLPADVQLLSIRPIRLVLALLAMIARILPLKMTAIRLMNGSSVAYHLLVVHRVRLLSLFSSITAR